MRVKLTDGSVKEVNGCYGVRLIACGKAVAAPKTAAKPKPKGEAHGA